MSSLRKLASQTAVYGLSSIIGRLVVWGFTPILTKYMPTHEYGIFSDLYSFITYFLVILTFGMETSFFRFAKTDKLDMRAYNVSFNYISIFAIGFLLLFSGANPLLSGLLWYPDRPGLIWFVTFITFLDVITALPMAKLRNVHENSSKGNRCKTALR